MAISQEMKIKARQANLVQYLRDHHYTLKPDGRKGNFRVLGKLPGLIVKENYWICKSNPTMKGNAVDFLMQIEGCSYPVAVELLLGYVGVQVSECSQVNQRQSVQAVKHDFKLPTVAPNNDRAIKYLTNVRKIPLEIVQDLIAQGLLYEYVSNRYHNCLFVCMDQKAAVWRGTTVARSRGMVAGSNASYPWVWPTGANNSMIVCESPIDCMSLHTLRPRSCVYVAVNGLQDAAIERAIQTFHTETIIFAVDNDTAGLSAIERWQEPIRAAKIEVAIEKPILKDWNEDLFLIGREAIIS